MAMDTLKKGFSNLFGRDSSFDEDYVEIDVEQKEKKSKIIIRPFVIKKFEDINDILAALREGYTIAVIDIRQIKSRDIVELKRAISKIKKTVEALDGSVAGFGENTIIATPSFAEIYKPGMQFQQPQAQKDPMFEE
ncbi:MAG: cell division protein SepF [Nanoarchaeota archaeon]